MKLFVGMPLYDGKPERQTEESWDTLRFNPPVGLDLVMVKVQAYSAAKGRNLLIHAAEKAQCDKILFIDGDVVFTPQQVARIASHQVDIVGGLYPRLDVKELRWVCSFAQPKAQSDGLVEVLEIGAGFLCVSMYALNALSVHRDSFRSEDDQIRGAQITNHFFDSVVSWKHSTEFPWNRLLTEDFSFCYHARRDGMRVYADTLCQVGHIKSVDLLHLHLSRCKPEELIQA